MEQATLKDVRVIAQQIGRRPRGLYGIAVRCPYGYPQVIVVHPIVEGKPFPTIYWLTCPYLSKGIDRLEAEGLIGKLEEKLRGDDSLRERLAAAHRSYIVERDRLLSSADRRYLEERGMMRSLNERGIGGIADFSRLKCLHLHVAHALVSGNPIGEIVLDLLERRACPEEDVICSGFESEDPPP